MADESMVRNLAAQAEAIWPQEVELFDRYAAAAEGQILDVGCGTGEITARLAVKFPRARIVGVDLEEGHLERARDRCAEFGARVTFQSGDALALPFDHEQFELVVCRHLLQAVPDARRVLEEIQRVLRPRGDAHLLAEDYGMLFCHPTELGSDGFWHHLPPRYAAAVGCDLHVGRKMFTLLQDIGMTDIGVEYLTIDTLRVPRDTFARIWEAWRDGYTEALVEHGEMTRGEIERRWKEMIDCVRDERGYALWQIPLWTARKA